MILSSRQPAATISCIILRLANQVYHIRGSQSLYKPKRDNTLLSKQHRHQPYSNSLQNKKHIRKCKLQCTSAQTELTHLPRFFWPYQGNTQPPLQRSMRINPNDSLLSGYISLLAPVTFTYGILHCTLVPISTCVDDDD